MFRNAMDCTDSVQSGEPDTVPKSTSRVSDNQGPTCPVCGTSDTADKWCKHLVTVRCDDCDGFDAAAPLYFGNGVMGDEFDELFNALVTLAATWMRASEVERCELERVCMSLAVDLEPLIDSVIDQLKALSCQTNDEEELRNEIEEQLLLDNGFRDLFEACWKVESTAISAENWEVSHSPGLTWSGTTFWASDAQECAKGICNKAASFTEIVEAIVA